jgi:hypothetical protein
MAPAGMLFGTTAQRREGREASIQASCSAVDSMVSFKLDLRSPR